MDDPKRRNRPLEQQGLEQRQHAEDKLRRTPAPGQRIGSSGDRQLQREVERSRIQPNARTDAEHALNQQRDLSRPREADALDRTPPQAQDRKLQNYLDNLYRPTARIGDGSTAAAIRYERRTGTKVGGRSHILKGQEHVSGLERWLKQHPDAVPEDIRLAQRELQTLRDALNGK